MAATQYLGAYNATGTSPRNVTLTFPAPPFSVLLITVGFASAAGVVTSIAVTLPATASGSFFKITDLMGASRGLELWMGYNLANYPSQITVTWTGGSTALIAVSVVSADSSCATQPTQVVATNSGTSTAADSGTITPAVGDIIVAAACWANATASTARTSFGNTFCWNAGLTGSSTAVYLVVNTAQAAASSHHTWTITSAAWVGAVAALAMPTPAAPVSAFVYKGRDTAAEDAGDVA